jgi:hypothetical protein
VVLWTQAKEKVKKLNFKKREEYEKQKSQYLPSLRFLYIRSLLLVFITRESNNLFRSQKMKEEQGQQKINQVVLIMTTFETLININ